MTDPAIALDDLGGLGFTDDDAVRIVHEELERLRADCRALASHLVSGASSVMRCHVCYAETTIPWDRDEPYEPIDHQPACPVGRHYRENPRG